jgi:hypothetical protein
VAEILSYAALHADDIRRLERDADRETRLEGGRGGPAPRPNLAVAYRLAARGVEPVVLEVLKPTSDSGGGRAPLLATGELRTYQIPVNDRFHDSLAVPLPLGYYLPAAEAGVAALLRLHGIQVERLQTAATDSVEILKSPELKWAPQEFQGHHLLSVTGTWARAARTVPAGTYFVSAAQPLGRLVFALLEPEGYGLARWGVFDRLLGSETGALSGMVYGSGVGGEFPVWRAIRAPRAPTRVLP